MKDECKETRTDEAYVPVYKPFDEFRQDISATSPKTLNEPGKIFNHKDHLLINERNKGIHVVDNSDPASPQIISVIPIPGNVDMAVRNNALYADSFTDLLVFDLSNPDNPEMVDRFEDVFPYDPYQYTPYEGKYVRDVDPAKGVVVDWKLKEVEAERACGDGQNVVPGQPGGERFFYDSERESSTGPSSTTTYSYSSGSNTKQNTMTKAGSMSRFTVTESDHLYSVKGDELGVFDLTDPKSPSKTTDRTIDHNIETIFAYNENLFIGAQDGMHIYDIMNPASPSEVSTYEHVEQCDPVVVQDEHAYVTLRSGNDCGGWLNELQVIDVSDPSDPTEEKSYELNDPHGLDIRGNELYVCDGDNGLVAFDAANTPDLDEISSVSDIHGYDAITLPDVLMVVGEDGLYQYDRSQGAQALDELSSIPVYRD